MSVEYITTDLSAPNVDVHTDITKMKFPRDRFDLIICSHVLEHIPRDRAAIAEMYRVLATEGLAIIMVPWRGGQPTDEDESVQDPVERQRRFGQFDHVRIYGFDFVDRVRSAGFKVRTIMSDKIGAPPEYGIFDMPVFICTKPVINNRVPD